ncbi:MAG: hypothetical protein H6617_10685 [Bdellovibrionaceae bacterium]|nr:hypothetical protein [Bdellovibrionales bacterium]MCB9255137.1 hypothetical protein [Pseudobdellovibrionaceae bacterium]
MKNLLLSLVVLSLATIGNAQPGPGGPHGPHGQGALKNALDTEAALMNFSNEALFQADSAAHPRAVEALDRLSDESAVASRTVHRVILRPLKNGTPEHHVAGSLSDVEYAVSELGRSLERLPFANPQLRASFQRVQFELNQLARALQNQPTPLTASCSVKTGGNFFTPKSHVECTVYGRGAIGYEAILGGRDTVHGELQPHLPTQNFVSEKVKVGYNPTYQIYLITRGGERILVAQN